jgi:hypothetical protein
MKLTLGTPQFCKYICLAGKIPSEKDREGAGTSNCPVWMESWMHDGMVQEAVYTKKEIVYSDIKIRENDDSNM